MLGYVVLANPRPCFPGSTSSQLFCDFKSLSGAARIRSPPSDVCQQMDVCGRRVKSMHVRAWLEHHQTLPGRLTAAADEASKEKGLSCPVTGVRTRRRISEQEVERFQRDVVEHLQFMLPAVKSRIIFKLNVNRFQSEAVV